MRPERVFERIKTVITSILPESGLPPEFKVEFKIMPQTLQFDILADDQIKLIIEVVNEMLKKIHDMVDSSGKSEYSYSMTYPFETRTEQERAAVRIEIQYRKDGGFTGERIIISRVDQ